MLKEFPLSFLDVEPTQTLDDHPEMLGLDWREDLHGMGAIAEQSALQFQKLKVWLLIRP
jgi:hypothetical protein